MSDEHAVVRTMRRMIDAILSRDWDAYAALVADDSIAESRRLVMRSQRGKADSIEQARAIADIGLNAADAELIEARGERAALLRVSGRASDFEVRLLCVALVDEEGRFLRSAYFDDDAIDAAYEELASLDETS